MTPVFADTHFFLALLNPVDEAHVKAASWAQTAHRPAVTTQWVLLEVANALKAMGNRERFLEVLRMVSDRADFEVIAAGPDAFQRGVELFSRRTDKEWSLTDCISFDTMDNRHLREALTGDHHFEQAGFVALLK